jgi:hypothetical protein
MEIVLLTNDGLKKLADGCRVKADLYRQAHPEIPASFIYVANEIDRLIRESYRSDVQERQMADPNGIVKRLRNRGAPLTRARELSPTAALCLEAAAEIEKLRAAVAAAR